MSRAPNRTLAKRLSAAEAVPERERRQHGEPDEQQHDREGVRDPTGERRRPGEIGGRADGVSGSVERGFLGGAALARRAGCSGRLVDLREHEFSRTGMSIRSASSTRTSSLWTRKRLSRRRPLVPSSAAEQAESEEANTMSDGDRSARTKSRGSGMNVCSSVSARTDPLRPREVRRSLGGGPRMNPIDESKPETAQVEPTCRLPVVSATLRSRAQPNAPQTRRFGLGRDPSTEEPQRPALVDHRRHASNA